MRQLTLFNELILPPRSNLAEVKELLAKLRKLGPVVGTDEAGRGALAGPVIAASVFLTPKQERELLAMKLRDSKKLSPKQRDRIFAAMEEMGVVWCAHTGSIKRIEKDNILVASMWTMGMSLKKLAEKLPKPPVCVVVDGTERIQNTKIPQWTLIQADNLAPVVSAASIIAKVLRDRLMVDMAEKYPGYDFEQNKGYPTMQHIATVKEKGMCAIHRPYFCKKLIAEHFPDAISYAAD